MKDENNQIVAMLYLYSKDQGGRQSHTLDSHFSFRVKIDENFFDARALLTDIGQLRPGDRVELSVKFLNPAKVFQVIKVGDKFPVFETSQIGDIEIVAIPIRSEAC